MKLISCGLYNRYYKYILLSTFFKILNDSLYGFNYSNAFKEVKIFGGKKQKRFSKHYLVHQIFNYIGTALMSFLFEKYQKKTENKNNKKYILKNQTQDDNQSDLNSSRTFTHIILIHNKAQEENEINNYKEMYKPSLIIIFAWISEEILLTIYGKALKDLDFWMFELLIITYLSAHIFKIKIYKHQKFAILFNLFPCILKIITIVLSFKEDKEVDLEPDDIIVYKNSGWWIPLGIIIYVILITLRAYVNTITKWFMDLKYISQSKLLIMYGIIGSIISLFISIITTFIKCNDEKKFFRHICRVEEEDSNPKIYFDNFKLYFENFDSNAKEIFIELAIIIFGFITFFLSVYFSILVIKYLTPVHLIFSSPIYYIIQKVILVINNLIRENTFFKDTEPYKFVEEKFSLDISGDIISLIGFLIYLEIIELNFNEYNYNLRKNIIQRGLVDSEGLENLDMEAVNDIEIEEEIN